MQHYSQSPRDNFAENKALTRLENELRDKYNECLNMRLYISWGQYLKGQYEYSSERKQYNRCALIQDLIIEDINS